MAQAPDLRLEAFLAKLALASSHEEEEELGRGELSSLLHRVSAKQLNALASRQFAGLVLLVDAVQPPALARFLGELIQLLNGLTLRGNAGRKIGANTRSGLGWHGRR